MLMQYQTCLVGTVKTQEEEEEGSCKRVVLLVHRPQLIARFFHFLACYSPITRPSCDIKRQRSPDETMRPLGAVDLDADL